jgi:hypothetical protein
MRSIGRRLNPRAPKTFRVHGYAVKTLESKETRASKEIRVTHNSVFAAHRLQCRMTNRKKRHPAFCLEIESGNEERRKTEKRVPLPCLCQACTLFLNPRNMSGGKLPKTIALDQRVRELHDSIERLAVRCSFHTCFSENDCSVIAVKPR